MYLSKEEKLVDKLRVRMYLAETINGLESSAIRNGEKIKTIMMMEADISRISWILRINGPSGPMRSTDFSSPKILIALVTLSIDKITCVSPLSHSFVELEAPWSNLVASMVMSQG